MTTDNPFTGDPDRHEIWEILVRRDIAAYAAQDWSATAPDFDPGEFHAIDARGASDPDKWTIGFATLESYRDSWLASAADLSAHAVDLVGDLTAATHLHHIEISGDKALAHKKFLGRVRSHAGDAVTVQWQSVYQLRKQDDRWYITGFVGYLPNPAEPQPGVKTLPVTATQHAAAGPYSPVLIVRPQTLVVISGQAPLDENGQVIGDDIATQTAATLANCARQLETAGAGFGDVFKVNVFLRDLADWAAFNVIYEDAIPAPLPVRTAVGTALLPGLLVEVEMWAAL